MYKPLTIAAVAALVTGCSTPNTSDFTDAYTGASINTPVTVTVATNAAPENRGRIDFDCPDNMRDSLDYEVAGEKLVLTSSDGEEMGRCNVILHADDGFALEIEHDEESSLYHARGGNLHVTAGVNELRVFTFSDSSITFGDMFADELKIEAYDQASIDFDGTEFIADEIRADLYDDTSMMLEGIVAQNVRIDTSWSATADVAGQAGKTKVDADQDSFVDAGALISTEAEVNADGSTEVTVYAVDKAEVSAENSARVEVLGDPSETDVTQEDDSTIIGI